MQASFIAYGPSFRRNITMEPFMNVELFGLFCQLLDIECSPNNGTEGSLSYILRSFDSAGDTGKPETWTSYEPISTGSISVGDKPVCDDGSCGAVGRNWGITFFAVRMILIFNTLKNFLAG